jgi:hypothetical protein
MKLGRRGLVAAGLTALLGTGLLMTGVQGAGAEGYMHLTVSDTTPNVGDTITISHAAGDLCTIDPDGDGKFHVWVAIFEPKGMDWTELTSVELDVRADGSWTTQLTVPKFNPSGTPVSGSLIITADCNSQPNTYIDLDITAMTTTTTTTAAPTTTTTTTTAAPTTTTTTTTAKTTTTTTAATATTTTTAATATTTTVATSVLGTTATRATGATVTSNSVAYTG